MLILPSPHTLPNTHSAYIVSFPSPFSLNFLGQLYAYQNDCGHGFWFFFPHKKQKQLGWVKTG